MDKDPNHNPLFLAALVVLLEKHGPVTFTDAEYQAIKNRFGGADGFSIHAAVTQHGEGQEPSVTVSLAGSLPGSSRPV